MRPAFKIAIVLLLGLGLLTQFTNCDVYSDSSVFDAASSTSCIGVDCDTADAEILELSAPVEVFILSTARSIDLGGECNEAGFPNNIITWNLMTSIGASINNCTGTGSGVCGKCVMGRYQLLVNFAAVPVTGWLIEVEIKGINSDGDLEAGRAPLSRRTINVRIP